MLFWHILGSSRPNRNVYELGNHSDSIGVFTSSSPLATSRERLLVGSGLEIYMDGPSLALPQKSGISQLNLLWICVSILVIQLSIAVNQTAPKSGGLKQVCVIFLSSLGCLDIAGGSYKMSFMQFQSDFWYGCHLKGLSGLKVLGSSGSWLSIGTGYCLDAQWACRQEWLSLAPSAFIFIFILVFWQHGARFSKGVHALALVVSEVTYTLLYYRPSKSLRWARFKGRELDPFLWWGSGKVTLQKAGIWKIS